MTVRNQRGFTQASYHAAQTPEQPNPSIPSEISITPELKSAFLSSLEERGISLRFFARSWEAFDLTNTPPQGYDIVLTSKTIYRTETLPSSSPCYARLVMLRIADAPKVSRGRESGSLWRWWRSIWL